MENEKKNRNRHPTKENTLTVNKYVKKKYSVEYAIRKLEGKVGEWARIPPPIIQSKRKHYHPQSNRTSHSLLEGMQNATVTLEGSLVISHKTIHILIMIQQSHGLYPDGLKLMSMHKIIMLASFITVQTWKQSRCPLTGKRRNKLWCSGPHGRAWRRHGGTWNAQY